MAEPTKPSTGKPVDPITPSDLVTSAHLDVGSMPNGSKLVVAAHHQSVVVVCVDPSTVRASSLQLTATAVVRCVAVDAQRSRIAIGGDGKSVQVYRVNQTTTGCCTEPLTSNLEHTLTSFNKRVVAVAFDPATGALFAGDKFGDVYRTTFEDTVATTSAKPILGHMSMVTCIAIRGNRLVTADRDGAIRVSRLDLPDVIEGFLWYPTGTAGGERDIITVGCTWLPTAPLTLCTTSNKGIVGLWDLTRPDIDNHAALVAHAAVAEPTVSVCGVALGGTQDNPVFLLPLQRQQSSAVVDASPAASNWVEAKLDGGALQVEPRPAAPKTTWPPTLVAKDGVLLLRSGALAVLNPDLPAPVEFNASLQRHAKELASLDVVGLWRTRGAGGAPKDDGEEDEVEEDSNEKGSKVPPRSELAS